MKKKKYYRSKNEFKFIPDRYPHKNGKRYEHPHYIFAETDNVYKGFAFTHSPDKSHDYYKMHHNPNPKDLSPSYMNKKPVSIKKSVADKKKNRGDWKVLDPDKWYIKKKVRDYRKKYKKR